MKDLNVDALFLGPKSENHKFFKEMLDFLMDEHMFWRRDFHPDDPLTFAFEERQREDFIDTTQRTAEALMELSAKLKSSSEPWFSPRYMGHMNTDTLMAANLAYMATILYNPNNCAFEASMATTAMELEAGKQLGCMFGFDPDTTWGHITSGGTVANYESLWMARNLKSIPLAIGEVAPELVEGKDEWQLLNLPTREILDLLDEARKQGTFDKIREKSARGIGAENGKLGKWLVPQSKHVSWTKSVDVLGIGQENMISIQVKDDFRTDITHLKETIDRLVSEKTPILGVVSVVGSTEEGAVDQLHEVVKLRDEYEKNGISFYLHVDAAYGGYTRSIFLNEHGHFMSFDGVKDSLHDMGVLRKEIEWPNRDVYEAYRAISDADSVTVDPHKMGYVPYAAGAIAIKDKRILDLISYSAAYIFEKGDENPMALGSFIMEGSKSGAAAAAVWVAHKVVPLNVTGYGKIIGRGIEGAVRFYDYLLTAENFEVDGKRYRVEPLVKPDFNIVDFAFNRNDNTSLEAMDALNKGIYDQCSYVSGPVYQNDFITSKTNLEYQHYGDAPRSFVERLGIPAEEWDRIKSVYVLRSCVMVPYLIKLAMYEDFWARFVNIMLEKIGKIESSRR